MKDQNGIDRPTPPSPGPAPISHAAKLLKRAALIDPFAWATPLERRYQKRRNASYEAALKEAAFLGHVPFVDDAGNDTLTQKGWFAGEYGPFDYRAPPGPEPEEPVF